MGRRGAVFAGLAAAVALAAVAALGLGHTPIPPGEPSDDRPDIHPVPPPTDPAPPVI